jgi:hypothetical protein
MADDVWYKSAGAREELLAPLAGLPCPLDEFLRANERLGFRAVRGTDALYHEPSDRGIAVSLRTSGL